MSEGKILRPPFVWAGKELVEDMRYQRWSPSQIKAMHNGLYDWSQHQELRPGEAAPASGRTGQRS